ncbi:MAG: hypothetical protein KF911_03370 [Pseudomonadales bacterium]|nr:hypothetical protein [Pseudomonadales bacterium]
MAEKIEFASPEWLAALERLVREYTAKAGAGVELSLCEVFTGVPAHLDKNGNGIIAWYCRIKGGEVEFEEGEIPEADIKTVTDYQFILPFARLKIDPGNMADYEVKLAEGAKAGKIDRRGDRSKVPPAFYGMHNDLAEITR